MHYVNSNIDQINEGEGGKIIIQFAVESCCNGRNYIILSSHALCAYVTITFSIGL